MNETKATHTPGPWQAERQLTSYDEPYIRIESRSEDPAFRLREVAEIWVDTRADFIEMEEANGRLIAAAPDLLAACIAGLKEVAFDARHDPNLDATAKLMRDAIAKATGAQ